MKDFTSASFPKMETHKLKPTVLASSLPRSGAKKHGVPTSRVLAGAALASLSLLGAACSSDSALVTKPVDEQAPGIIAGTLEVALNGQALKLRNTTERQVGFMVVDKNQLVVALYPPCGEQCASVVQGATANVPFSQIGGYTPESTEATVMWFRYQNRTDGKKVPEGAMQMTHIKLK
ncbi:MAG: hypothetical protein ACO1Q7_20140 [Gemmatimonas sp.]